MPQNQPAFIEPVICLFSEIDQLKRYESFTVERSFQTRSYRNTSVAMFYVVGASNACREVIAEFAVEIQASIFRDMAEISAHASR